MRAVKAVSLAEEYLGDHFPSFPVLPGVFMLEAMVEAAGWLVRVSHEFRVSVILLASAKNVTYKSFVKPGNLLELDIECRALSETESEFKGSGTCAGAEMVKARFSLRHGYVDAFATRRAARPATESARSRSSASATLPGSTSKSLEPSKTDEKLINHARARYALLRG